MHSVRELGGVDDHYNLYKLIGEFLKFKYTYTNFLLLKYVNDVIIISIILNILGVKLWLTFQV